MGGQGTNQLLLLAPGTENKLLSSRALRSAPSGFRGHSPPPGNLTDLWIQGAGTVGCRRGPQGEPHSCKATQGCAPCWDTGLRQGLGSRKEAAPLPTPPEDQSHLGSTQDPDPHPPQNIACSL